MQHRPPVSDRLNACVSRARSSVSRSSVSCPPVSPSGFVDAMRPRRDFDAALHADWSRDEARAAVAKEHGAACALSGTAWKTVQAATAAAAAAAMSPSVGVGVTPPASTLSVVSISHTPTPSPPQFQSAPPARLAGTPAHTVGGVGVSRFGTPSPAAAEASNPWMRGGGAHANNSAAAAASSSAAVAGASSVASPSVAHGGATGGFGFDRSRDLRERDQALRGAEATGWAAPKHRPMSTDTNDSRGKWDRSPLERSGWGDRERGFEDVEGDERAPRYKKARTDSPSPPPPSTVAGATAVAGSNPFVSGNAKLADDMAKKYGSRVAADAAIRRQREEATSAAVTTAPKSLGGKRAKFTPPYRKPVEEESSGPLNPMVRTALAGPGGKEGEVHPKLQGLDAKLVEMITSEMMESPGVAWSDIAGLEFAKKSVREIVVWPILRPELFTGLRGPPKGLLLFGPPGTGKTLIGKAIASESKSRFFSISASSLTSKWHGEGEKLVRTLFAVAQVHEPSIIFIDEIDSLLSQRQESEFEASRRIKTEFLVQLDGATTTGKERVLVVGATNRPQELVRQKHIKDEAARRRLVKKLYIPLPEYASRMQLLRLTMSKQGVDHRLSEADFESIVHASAGYSGSDMAALCTEASMGPIRHVTAMMDTDDLAGVNANDVRAIEMQDFDAAFQSIRPSVNQKDLTAYVEWNNQYGSFPMSSDASTDSAAKLASSRADAQTAAETKHNG